MHKLTTSVCGFITDGADINTSIVTTEYIDARSFNNNFPGSISFKEVDFCQQDFQDNHNSNL